MRSFIFFVFSCLLALPVIAEESALSALSSAFPSPEKEKKEVKNIYPEFNPSAVNELISAIKENYPSAKNDDSERYSSTSKTLILKEGTRAQIIEGSDKQLYQLYLSFYRLDKKLTSVACSVIVDYPNCDGVLNSLYKVFDGVDSGRETLRCGDLKVELKKLKGHYTMLVAKKDFKDKRYSNSCY